MLTLAVLVLVFLLALIAYLLTRVEERLAHLNEAAMIWLSGHSTAQPVFAPVELHRQLARAGVAHEQYVRAAEHFFAAKTDERKSADFLRRVGDYVGAQHDRDYESWRYSLMIEANLKTALGQVSRDEALAQVRAFEPRHGEVARAAAVDASLVESREGPPSREPHPWDGHAFQYPPVHERAPLASARIAAVAAFRSTGTYGA